MTKQEQLARLALARAEKRPGLMVVIATDNARELVRLIRTISHGAVLSIAGNMVRIHHRNWATPRAAKAA